MAMAGRWKEGETEFYFLPALGEARQGSCIQVRESFLCALQRARDKKERRRSTVRARV